MKTIKKLLFLFVLMGSVLINAQIGIGTMSPDASSILDVSSSNKGVLFPRMTSVERNGISNPAVGLIIYNTDEKRIENNIGTLVGPIWEAFGKTGLTGLQGPTGPAGSVTTNAGGTTNFATGDGATIVGGIANKALGTTSTVGGGGTNTVSGTSSTIVGGMTNIASSVYSTISGGLDNKACGIGATVAGGVRNEACGDYATIAGGTDNKASATTSTVAGGTFNSAIGINSVISGGYLNNAAGLNATVAGGSINSASGKTASVSGGESNLASGDYSTVSGGGFNFAPSYGEWVGGMYGTNPSSVGSKVSFVETDRIFNVGNGTGLGTRSDAFTVLKNGLATLPSVINSLIAADPSGKAIVTKEYLEYKVIKVIGVTSYTLLQSDVSVLLYFTAGSPVTIFVPSGFKVNSRFEGKQIGVGELVFSGSGSTINIAAKDTLKTAGQYSAFSLDWIASNTFLLYGSLKLIP
jgi:hypothetical protein